MRQLLSLASVSVTVGKPASLALTFSSSHVISQVCDGAVTRSNPLHIQEYGFGRRPQFPEMSPGRQSVRDGVSLARVQPCPGLVRDRVAERSRKRSKSPTFAIFYRPSERFCAAKTGKKATSGENRQTSRTQNLLDMVQTFLPSLRSFLPPSARVRNEYPPPKL